MVKVAVIGCGDMGVKIAGELILQGHHVSLHDCDPSRLNVAKETIEKDRLQLTIDGFPKFNHQRGTILYMDSLKLAVHNADFIFESVVEDLAIKKNIFKEISKYCSGDSIIGSGTISLCLDRIVEDVKYPERTLGVRFIYPVLCMPDVEVSRNSFTSHDVVTDVHRFLSEMGKHVISRSEEVFVLTEKEAEFRRMNYLEKMASKHNNFVFQPSTGDDDDSSSIYVASPKSPSINMSLFPSSSVTPGLKTSLSSPPVTPGLKTSSSSPVTSGNVKDSSINRLNVDPLVRECAICMDAERDTLLCPCRHLITCSSCSWSLIINQESCPICRAPIEEILHVFHS